MDEFTIRIQEFILKYYLFLILIAALLLLLVLAAIIEQIKKHTLATREVAAEIRELRHLLEADARNSQMYTKTNPKPYIPQYKTDTSGDDGSGG